jgi:hypothetical protein
LSMTWCNGVDLTLKVWKKSVLAHRVSRYAGIDVSDSRNIAFGETFRHGR